MNALKTAVNLTFGALVIGTAITFAAFIGYSCFLFWSSL